MTLQELLQIEQGNGAVPPEVSNILANLPEIPEIEITGLSSDSRYARKGDLFFAKKGEKSHGLDYLPQLLEIGVAAIIYEKDEAITKPNDIYALEVSSIDALMRVVTQRYYQSVQDHLALIGVTGTEGKTSVTQFIAKAFQLFQVDCGVIGTNGIGILGNLKENTHTTPDLLALYQSLEDIAAIEGLHTLEDGRLPVALEVTSHALDQKRVEGLHFQTTVFTNLNRDHLDYHGTVEAYGAAKARLFWEYPQQSSVINIDDPFGKKLYESLSQTHTGVRYYPFGSESYQAEHYLQITELKLHEKGLNFTLRYQGNDYPVESHLYGAFNAYNLVAAIGVLLSLGLEINRIMAVIPEIAYVQGRMEMVHLKNGAVAVVDYAHKPNALQQALISLRAHLEKGKLISLFGCGGNRDKGKRPLMAEISEKYADEVVITSDNPRFEDPLMIIEDIKAGLQNPTGSHIVVEPDRALAIKTAIMRSQPGDIILIAGKGHEDYQILGDREIYFSDLAEVKKNNEEL